jgi:hypothetical protein
VCVLRKAVTAGSGSFNRAVTIIQKLSANRIIGPASVDAIAQELRHAGFVISLAKWAIPD